MTKNEVLEEIKEKNYKYENYLSSTGLDIYEVYNMFYFLEKLDGSFIKVEI